MSERDAIAASWLEAWNSIDGDTAADRLARTSLIAARAKFHPNFPLMPVLDFHGVVLVDPSDPAVIERVARAIHDHSEDAEGCTEPCFSHAEVRASYIAKAAAVLSAITKDGET